MLDRFGSVSIARMKFRGNTGFLRRREIKIENGYYLTEERVDLAIDSAKDGAETVQKGGRRQDGADTRPHRFGLIVLCVFFIGRMGQHQER